MDNPQTNSAWTSSAVSSHASGRETGAFSATRGQQPVTPVIPGSRPVKPATSVPVASSSAARATPAVDRVQSDAVAAFCQQIKRWCGIHLDHSKSYLIENRLRSVIRDYNTKDLAGLVKLMGNGANSKLRDRVVDAVTTHETLFFRDQSPFDAITGHILPEIKSHSKGKPSLRVWSAACSTGQEPYSIAMMLTENVIPLSNWSIEILATDVAAPTLDFAKRGIYQTHEVSRGIDAARKRQFFNKTGNDWQINDSIRSMIKFQLGNLTSMQQPTGTFDLIFCRNVLIYFKPEDARKILERLADRLGNHGRLFVGCSEVLNQHQDILKQERLGSATCYRRAESTRRTK